MGEIERVKVEGGVDIFQTVKAARAQRPHMVYTSVSDASHEIICTSRSNIEPHVVYTSVSDGLRLCVIRLL